MEIDSGIFEKQGLLEPVGIQPQRLFDYSTNIYNFDQGQSVVTEVQLPLPVVEIQYSDQREEFTIYGKNGNADKIHGLYPRPEETLESLVRRTYPDMPENLLDKQMKQILKYNTDYDNQLDDKSTLTGDKPVYLTSLKLHDQEGRLATIIRPDGSKVKLNYLSSDGSDISSIKIEDFYGKTVLECSSNEDKPWTITGANRFGFDTFDRIRVDQEGNIDFIGSGTNLNRLQIKSNCKEVEYKQDTNKNLRVLTRINSGELSREDYRVEGAMIIKTTTYPDELGLPPKTSRLQIELTDTDNPFKDIYPETRQVETMDKNTEKVMTRIQESAKNTAHKMNSYRRCAEAVQLTLADAGMPEFLGSGHAWQMLKPLLDSGKFVEISDKDVAAGDLMLRKSAYGDYGHIATIVERKTDGTLVEASDHIDTMNPQNNNYSKTVFLRYSGDRQSSNH